MCSCRSRLSFVLTLLRYAFAEARAAELVVRYNALIESLRAAHRMLRRGLVSRGIQMLEEELDGVLSDDGESDEPAEAMPVQRHHPCGRASGASCADDAAARARAILQRPLLPSGWLCGGDFVCGGVRWGHTSG